MHTPVKAQRLRIFIDESDRYEGKLLLEAIVNTALKKGLAGATVLRGVMGYGANSQVHTNKILRLSEKMPVVIEIVDSNEKIENFLPTLSSMIQEGLVTQEEVQVVLYRHTKG